MDDLADYCFRLSRSQGMSYLRESRGNYDTMSILTGVAPSIRPYIVSQIRWMTPDGVL